MGKVSVSGSRAERKAQVNAACRVTAARAQVQLKMRNHCIESKDITVGTRGDFSAGHSLGRG